NKEQAVNFTVSTKTGEQWVKQIRLTVSPPEKFELFQNYPNPFNPTTVFSFELPVSGFVALKVFNLLGEEVATIVDEQQEAGYHEKSWDARQNAGGLAGGSPSGVYFYQLSYVDRQGKPMLERKRMVLLK
ncbi:MAG TPA: T9SS type A sorting domain-containing protein, partial [Bacteroidota bacterium]|nr:T9SS type A sorting domain-containing protein [Bacteroidota bacterium]